MDKEQIENLLSEYGVTYTTALADKLLEIIARERADAIDELKSNCITHILRKRPLTLEEITNIIFFEAEQLKEKKK